MNDLSYLLKQVRKRLPSLIEVDRNKRSFLIAPGTRWMKRNGQLAIFHDTARAQVRIYENFATPESRVVVTVDDTNPDLVCDLAQARLHKLLNLERVKCGYCGTDADLLNGTIIYPHRPDLDVIAGYVCPNCQASVGTHLNSFIPLGTLANKRLKALRQQAHRAYDPIWKTGHLSRTKAYKWMQEVMNLEADKAHIAMMDELQCLELIEHIKAYTSLQALPTSDRM